MDSKFFVSLKAARLLKEKGYNRDINNYYDENGFLHDLEYDENYNYFQMSNNDLDLDHYAAPTKAEAIDWLDSKGIIILLYMYSIISEDYTIKACWGYNILRGDELLFTDNSSCIPTRLEAEEAAIIKACELLNENEE